MKNKKTPNAVIVGSRVVCTASDMYLVVQIEHKKTRELVEYKYTVSSVVQALDIFNGLALYYGVRYDKY
jgi:hypothetical protein